MTSVSTSLDWTHDTVAVGERTARHERIASAEDCERVAAALGILACEDIRAAYEIGRRGEGVYRLKGKVEARVTQACVVTLEPVTTAIAETFDVEFRRDIEPQSEGEQEILSAAEIEPVVAERIDAGRIVYETIAAALDPYPRKDGAEFDWSDPKSKDGSAHPFAALRALKDRES